MSEKRTSEVLGALPRTRPHRRSQKRPPAPAAGSTPSAPATAKRPARAVQAASRTRPPEPKRPVKRARPEARSRSAAEPEPKRPRIRQPAQPLGLPLPDRATPRSAVASGTDIIELSVRAAAELAEIGFAVSAQALRNAVSRLPHP